MKRVEVVEGECGWKKTQTEKKNVATFNGTILSSNTIVLTEEVINICIIKEADARLVGNCILNCILKKISNILCYVLLLRMSWCYYLLSLMSW